MAHRIIHSGLLLLFAVLPMQDAAAGIISSISKIARNVDAPSSGISKLPDGSLQYLDISLADGTPPNLLRSKLNADNQWVLRDSGGNVIANPAQVSNSALIIDRVHLPQDLSQLNSLPTGAPVLVRSNDHVFRLEHGMGWTVKAGAAAVRVDDIAELKSALSYFEMPWANGPVRILGLKDQAADSLSLRRGVDIKTLQNSPAQLRGQTIAMAGPIEGDRMSAAGKKLSISELRKTAEQYDISLIVLESKSRVAPKNLLKQLDGDHVNGVPQNTGQFLASLQQPGADTFFEISPTGRQQVVIRQQTADPVAAPALSDVEAAIVAQVVFKTAAMVSIYRPDEERSKELDARLVWWLPTWALGYLIVSAVLGLVVVGTTLDAFYFIWPRSGTHSDVLRYLEIGISLLVFFVLFLPLFGLPVTIGKIISLLYKATRWLLRGLFGIALLISKPFRVDR